MKVYNKLQLPKDTAWDRKPMWKRFVHWRIRYFIYGVYNIMRWVPTLYHDRDWDDYYVTKMLQKKIEYQRKHLVNSNRHTRVDEDNYWMTVALNLLEREHEDFYELEKYDYLESDIKFVPVVGYHDRYEIVETTTQDNLEAYLKKYKGAVRRVLKEKKDLFLGNKQTLAFHVGIYNQKRSRALLFRILKERMQGWWD